MDSKAATKRTAKIKERMAFLPELPTPFHFSILSIC
jgi:hypothetical protein